MLMNYTILNSIVRVNELPWQPIARIVTSMMEMLRMLCETAKPSGRMDRLQGEEFSDDW